MRDLVHEQLTAEGQVDGIEMSGPSALLTPQSAVSLSMVLHELGTNARKYGALSVPTGTVKVHWYVPEGADKLRIDWSESGGPTVRLPEKRGFGTTLIERSLKSIGGAATTHFEPQGFVCHLEVPLAPTKLETTPPAGSA